MLSLKSSLLMVLVPHLMHAASLKARDVVCNFATTASSGDTCGSFAGGWGLSTADFLALNPGVTCTNFIAGQDYCVIGTVTAQPSTTSTRTTSKASSTTSSTFSSKTSSTTSSKTSSATSSTTSSTRATSSTGHLVARPVSVVEPVRRR